MSNRVSVPDMAPQITEGETHGEAMMDGEKTGVIIRAAAMFGDKLCRLHIPVLSDVDTHVPLMQHVSPSRIMLTGIAAFVARNNYVRFRSLGKVAEHGMESVATADERYENWDWPQREQY